MFYFGIFCCKNVHIASTVVSSLASAYAFMSLFSCVCVVGVGGANE